MQRLLADVASMIKCMSLSQTMPYRLYSKALEKLLGLLGDNDHIEEKDGCNLLSCAEKLLDHKELARLLDNVAELFKDENGCVFCKGMDDNKKINSIEDIDRLVRRYIDSMDSWLLISRVLKFYSFLRGLAVISMLCRAIEDDTGFAIITAEILGKAELLASTRTPRDFHLTSYIISAAVQYVAARMYKLLTPWQVIRPISIYNSYYDAIDDQEYRLGPSTPATLTLVATVNGREKVSEIADTIRQKLQEHWEQFVENRCSILEALLRRALSSGNAELNPLLIRDGELDNEAFRRLCEKAKSDPLYTFIVTYTYLSGSELKAILLEDYDRSRLAFYLKSTGYGMAERNVWGMLAALAMHNHESFAVNKYSMMGDYRELFDAAPAMGQSVLCTNCYIRPYIIRNPREVSIVLHTDGSQGEEDYSLVLRPRERLCLHHSILRLEPKNKLRK